MNKGTVKQILLITDGCSNEGEDPIALAAMALEHGITVNVIGVMDKGTIDPKSTMEIEGIAAAGGGVSQVVYTTELSQTVQMVTQKAMTQTLQGVVNRELKQILGSSASFEKLSPEQRGDILEVVDELGETSELDVLILIDTSGSMKPKLPTVKDALFDLSISLNSRMGESQFAVFTFPGNKKEVDKVLDWTPKLESLSTVFAKFSTGGMTPTGPAIREAVAYFKKKRSLKGLLGNDERYSQSM